MKDIKQIFILGLIVGMILGGIIIISSFFLGNSYLGFDKIWTKSDYAPYFKTKMKGLFSNNTHQPPYRIKKIERNGKDYVYILEGIKNNPRGKPQMHPTRKAIKVSPM